ncbi:acyl-CoA dehydrogenase family protein [Nocardia bovistercoris]|uniref:Acyl-CoA dehydrogenase family protein n=1 Tax=Nocardia bovistercoris TaxID=2785916 RepID=A0A931N713_9NOCA|nr:acyl-CoA dehydrogenase family protein [Nocardia bovistercoris]MBH0781116.1 acyl-CoA dehydrogenase family protein [Nocardia bovistercoris]
MLLEFDSDQRLWQKTVRDVVAKHCPPTLIRDVVDRGADPRPLWKSYLQQGWTALTERAEAVELTIVLEELGRATDPTPFLATTTQFAPLAGGDAPEAAGAAIYEGISARRVGAGWTLEGSALVLDGDRAENLAVVTGAGVFVIAADRVRAHRISALDPVLHIARVTLEDVRVEAGDRVDSNVRDARAVALTGLAATVVGASQRVLDLVVEHVSGRQQFGVPIGSFQAVAHKAADMHVAVERARALTYWAALTISAADPRGHLAAVMAKAAASECQAMVFRHGLQLFGAMGYTWENDLQFALKRAKAADLLLGGGDEHRATIAKEYRAARI